MFVKIFSSSKTKAIEKIHLYRNIYSASFGIGLLYCIRGGFLPYFFPIFQKISTLSFAQISVLLNIFVLSQAFFSPLSAEILNRLSAKKYVVTGSLLFTVLLFLLILKSSFIIYIILILLLGSSLISLKNCFSVIVIHESPPDKLRTFVSLRSTFMNFGSFIGNFSSIFIISILNVKAQLIFLGLLSLFNAAFFYFSYVDKNSTKCKSNNNSNKAGDYFRIWKEKDFIKYSIAILPAILFDGCWGTIIPKYVSDLYQSDTPIAYIYATSMLTIVLLSIVLNTWLNKQFRKSAVLDKYHYYLPVILFGFGLFLFNYALSLPILIVGVFVFIIGEIVLIPCYDEIATNCANNNAKFTSSQYFGAIGLMDGIIRFISASFCLGLYGYLKNNSTLIQSYWLFVLAVFLIISCVSLLVYFIFTNRGEF